VEHEVPWFARGNADPFPYQPDFDILGDVVVSSAPYKLNITFEDFFRHCDTKNAVVQYVRALAAAGHPNVSILNNMGASEDLVLRDCIIGYFYKNKTNHISIYCNAVNLGFHNTKYTTEEYFVYEAYPLAAGKSVSGATLSETHRRFVLPKAKVVFEVAGSRADNF
jgi:hypothetical protein